MVWIHTYTHTYCVRTQESLIRARPALKCGSMRAVGVGRKKRKKQVIKMWGLGELVVCRYCRYVLCVIVPVWPTSQLLRPYVALGLRWVWHLRTSGCEVMLSPEGVCALFGRDIDFSLPHNYTHWNSSLLTVHLNIREKNFSQRSLNTNINHIFDLFFNVCF